MKCGDPFQSEPCLALRMELHKPLLIRSTLFTIPVPTHALNSGSIIPWLGPGKFVISGCPAGVSRFRARRSVKCVPACEITFSLRVSVRSDRTLAFATTTDQAHCGVGFHS